MSAYRVDSTGPSTGRAGRAWTVNRLVALVAGVGFLAAGIIGAFLHDQWGSAFANHMRGADLFGIFHVNGLHDVVHLALGATLLLGALAGHKAARSMNVLNGVGYLAVGVLGVLFWQRTWDVLSLDHRADNLLHLVGGALLLLVGLFADHRLHRDEKTVTERSTVSAR